MVGGGGSGLVATSGGLGVDSGALVSHVGDETVISVGGVLHVLDSAVGKSDRVGSGHVAGAIRSLLGLEVGLGVVIGDSVGEGVGGLLGEVVSDVSGLDRGVVSGGSVHHRGSVGGGSVHSVSNHRGGVDSVGHGVDGVVDGGGVDKRGMDSVSHTVGGDRVKGDNGGLALGDGPVGEHGGLDLSQALGVVSLGHAGVSGTECLALGQGSHLHKEAMSEQCS